MQKYLQKYSQTLIEYSYSISDQIGLKIGHLDQQPHLFHYTVLRKLLNSLVSIGLGLSNIYEYKAVLDSLTVTVRMSLSDIITWEYIRHLSNSDRELLDNINSLNYDHLVNLKKSIQKNYPVVLKTSQDRINDMITRLESNNKFYDSELVPKYKDLKFSVYSAIRYIFNNEKYSKDTYTLLTSAFINYDMYSKNEHLGEFSFYNSHIQLDDNWFDKAIFELCVSIIPITEYALRIFEEFKNVDDASFDRNQFIENLTILRKLAIRCPTHNKRS